MQIKRAFLFLLVLATVASALPAQAPAVNETELRSAGWQRVEEGFWQRQMPDGGVQSLAYGAGKLRLVPRLQGEIDRVLESFKAEPTADKAAALELLGGHLASLLSSPEAAALPTPKPVPISCQIANVDYGVFTFAQAPPGWHGIDATASAWWDGNGVYCPGHIYARASQSLTPVGGSTISDLEWCATDDNYLGDCWVAVYDPFLYPYASCITDAYVYLSLLNGAFAMDESKHWGLCNEF